MRQGELWLLHDQRSGKARPALIVTRDRAIPVLTAVTVAPAKAMLTRQLGHLGPHTETLICRALEAMADC